MKISNLTFFAISVMFAIVIGYGLYKFYEASKPRYYKPDHRKIPNYYKGDIRNTPGYYKGDMKKYLNTIKGRSQKAQTTTGQKVLNQVKKRKGLTKQA